MVTSIQQPSQAIADLITDSFGIGTTKARQAVRGQATTRIKVLPQISLKFTTAQMEYLRIPAEFLS
jgi:hypothetical protein